MSCPVDRSTVLPVWDELESKAEKPAWLLNPERNVYVAPTGIVAGRTAEILVETGFGKTFGDGSLVYTGCEVLIRDSGIIWSVLTSIPDVLEWGKQHGSELYSHVFTMINRIGVKRRSFAGISVKGPVLMGIVNVTPDSFSDGGKYSSSKKAIEHGLSLMKAGAHIIDVGGESTRPGAKYVSEEEEIKRVLPVVKGLAEKGAVVSIDTRKSKVMGACIEAGAKIVNDISALTDDAEALRVVSTNRVPVVLMHKQGIPENMQEKPDYNNPLLDVYDFLDERVDACEAAGIRRSDICVDPGIGFGKTLEHNLEIMSCLSLFQCIGCPVLLGVSRKSFIAMISRDEPVDERLAGSIVAAQFGLDQGVQILRVHDVKEMDQAISVWKAVRALS